MTSDTPVTKVQGAKYSNFELWQNLARLAWGIGSVYVLGLVYYMLNELLIMPILARIYH